MLLLIHHLLLLFSVASSVTWPPTQGTLTAAGPCGVSLLYSLLSSCGCPLQAPANDDLFHLRREGSFSLLTRATACTPVCRIKKILKISIERLITPSLWVCSLFPFHLLCSLFPLFLSSSLLTSAVSCVCVCVCCVLYHTHITHTCCPYLPLRGTLPPSQGKP
jgi:hypothetical protein